MDKMELPNGWYLTDLGAISNIRSGTGFPKKYQGNKIGEIPFFKVKDISQNYLNNQKYLTNADNYISKKDLEELKGRLLVKGSTVFAKIGEAIKLNRRAILTIDSMIDNNVMALKSFDSVDDLFIFYFLLTKKLGELSRSTTVPSIRGSDVADLEIMLPPLAEQKEIVRIIESHLQLVDQIKSRLDALPKILEQFRQSVLASAVSGKLTGIEVKENRVLEDYVFIENGARKPVSATIRKTMQGEIPYIGATGIIDYLNDYTHIGRYLLVGEDGANLLTKMKDLAFILNGEMWVNNHAHVLKEKEGVDLNFIKIAINAMDLKPWVTGSAQPKLTQRALRVLPIPYYLESEQKEIVKWVENLFTLADQIESKIKHAQERVNLLTQSILAKAFRGEFTAKWREDNPDLISGENSAEALLKRIEEAKKAAKKKK